MYPGIIDPSEFKMVKKSSDHVTLLKENRILTRVCIALISGTILIGIILFYYSMQEKRSKEEKFYKDSIQS
jgi:hypothetical protein